MSAIRTACTRDATDIAALQNHAIQHTTHTFTTTPKSAGDITIAMESQPFLVAANPAFQGFATLFPFRAGTGYARVREHSVYVAQTAQGKGIGAALMQALETRARSDGISQLLGAISGENIAAIAFHKRLGFTQTGQMPGIGHKFGREIDLVVMQKRL